MAIASHEPLFQIPWIWPNPQHFKIMVGFQDQYLGAAEPFRDVIRHVTDVCQLADLDSPTLDREGDRFRSIMRHTKRFDFHIADCEGHTVLYRYDLGRFEQLKLFSSDCRD